MTDLRFRIVSIPEEYDPEPSIASLTQIVENCGLHVIHIRENRPADSVTPEVVECIVEVEARNDMIISKRYNLEEYKNLLPKWMKETKNYPIGHRPLLQLFLDESFSRGAPICHKHIPCRDISFGVHAHSGEYILYATLNLENDLICNFLHDESKLELDFAVTHLYHRQIVISYHNIRNIIVDSEKSFFDLYLDLMHPPLFYSKKYNLQIEKWLVHRILPFNIDRGVVGKANLIRLRLYHDSENSKIYSRLRQRCRKMPVHFLSMDETCKLAPRVPLIMVPKHFGSIYMLTALFERTFTIIEQSLNLDILNLLGNFDSLEKALGAVLFAVDSGKMVNYWRAIRHVYSLVVKTDPRITDHPINEQCRLIRRVTFTPTRVLLWPAELMRENRILRHFDPDYFLRATFRDDNMSQLGSPSAERNVYDVAIKLYMIQGLQIGPRMYCLLAWSNSQLREHGVTMYARDRKGFTAQDILRWTGINDDVVSLFLPVSKYMARIGQCFSQTESTVKVPLDSNLVRFEKDIVGGLNPQTRKPYMFSEGVGKISTRLAKEVRENLGHDKQCSAFQVRYGGCKGMLLEDPNLKDADIVFRRSMSKYKAARHTVLEIARTSGPVSVRLNRPLVAILNDLGVGHYTFLKLQDNALSDLTDMLLDEVKASRYLNSRTPSGLVDFTDMMKAGIGLTTEPFCRAMLLALHRYHLDSIKRKASIEIDPSKGRNMFGVMDETRTLEYGQVFVQYTTDVLKRETDRSEATVLEGPVMVSKCPCIHPGDVRKFIAVDVPALHHVVDCIVFPQKGFRPHPDEMAGSDLDGDEYIVIWLEELFFPVANNAAPNYPEIELKQDFCLNDLDRKIVEFLVKYIQNDQLGSIALAHLAQADMHGVTSEICLSIAAKHAVAVDFPKTGRYQRLGASEQPVEYPDFMEKFWKSTRKSKKALGKMYRVSKDFEGDNLSAGLKYDRVQVDPSLVVPGWEAYKEDAIISRDKYNSWLHKLLQTYGIQNEAEAYAGAFIRLHTRFHERRDKAEIVKVVHATLKAIIRALNNDFYNEFSSSADVSQLLPEMLKKASAWYVVTYGDAKISYLSFPWIVSNVLANIKILQIAKIGDQPCLYAPLVVRLDQVIENCSRTRHLYSVLEKHCCFMNSLDYCCGRDIVENAVVALLMWGTDEHIITVATPIQTRFLYIKTFLRLVLHVAETNGYVMQKGTPKEEQARKPAHSAAALCLAFFKYCMRLRFYRESQVSQVLPFSVYRYQTLSKRATVAFHSIAVTGRFQILEDSESSSVPEIIEIGPICIDSGIFLQTPIEESQLENLEELLVKFSEAESVKMREKLLKRKVLVTARGTPKSLSKVRHFLRVPEILSSLILTGELPE